MRNLLFTILAVTVLSCNNNSNTITENTTNTLNKNTMEMQDKQNIQDLLATYKKSLNTSDAKLAVSLYTKDGLFMPTEAPTAHGTEELLKSYKFIFSQIQLYIEFYIDDIIIDDTIAFVTTSSKGTVLIHANGQSAPEENRELFVFEKINNEWKIARYMFNKITPQH